MRRAIVLILMVVAGGAQGAEPTVSPLEVVEARMQALNAHDLEAFLSLYADDVVVYAYPGIVLTSGKPALADIFRPLFEVGDVEVKLQRVIAVDSFVIVERLFSYGEVSEPGVAIYQVSHGLITRVEFVRDSRRARQLPRRPSVSHSPRSD